MEARRGSTWCPRQTMGDSSQKNPCAAHLPTRARVERAHMLSEVYLAGPVRTAIGAFGGTLSEVPAPALGATAVKGAMARSGVPAEAVDEVIFGNVVGAGLGQNVARQVTIGAGLAASIGATSV